MEGMVLNMKKAGKLAALLLAVCMIISIGVISAYAADDVPDTDWVDYAAAEFDGGTGTKDDPLKIATAEQLAKLTKDVDEGNSYNGSYFRLENDIDLSGHCWTSIGNYTATVGYISFGGFFDGNGKTITGMIVDSRSNCRSAGFFGYISGGMSGYTVGVKDLTIVDAKLYTDESGLDAYDSLSAGILAAGTMVNDGFKGTAVYENITVSGTIEVVGLTAGYHKVGGLIGDDNRGIVKNCKTDVNIVGATNVGGMVGISANTTFEDCEAKGKISGLWAVGGFVGYSITSTWDDKSTESNYKRCIADVDITVSNWNVGGFVGFAEFGKFENCASLGKVTSTVNAFEPRVGGFVGGMGDTSYLENSYPEFYNCHSASLVTSASTDYKAGGFAGNYSTGGLADCSYDKEKNAALNAIGEGETEQQAADGTTAETLENICIYVLGGHEYSEELTVDTEATCTEDGIMSQKCIRCGQKGELVIIPHSGHEWDTDYTTDKEPTCTVDGAKSIHCRKCDAKKDETVIKATGHTLEWVTDKEATETEDGWKHEVCKKGDYEGDPVKIPATGTSKTPADDGKEGSPNTGESSAAVNLAAILMLVSGAALFAVAAIKQKKSREQ